MRRRNVARKTVDSRLKVDRRVGLAYVPRHLSRSDRRFVMFIFLLVVQFLIAVALVVVILMQKSEGGGLGMGGSPSGLMSARGAADFLTRATATLATLFVLVCIGMAVLAATSHHSSIDTSLAHAPSAAPPVTQAPPPSGNPFASAAQNAAAAAANSSSAAPAAPTNDSVPLAH